MQNTQMKIYSFFDYIFGFAKDFNSELGFLEIISDEDYDNLFAPLLTVDSVAATIDNNV